MMYTLLILRTYLKKLYSLIINYSGIFFRLLLKMVLFGIRAK